MFGRVFSALLSLLGIGRAAVDGHQPPPEKMPCPKCSESIKFDAKICRFCGFRIISGTTDLMIAGKRISGDRRN